MRMLQVEGSVMEIFGKSCVGKSCNRVAGASLFYVLSLAVLPGCGYNKVIDLDEDVKASWSEVENQYQRRAELVPNLVSTVKGSAAFEQKTLQQVVKARQVASGVQADASILDDPAKFKAFEQAQQKLSGALSRLMMVVERYPDLKASAQFRDLQHQIEGIENRVATARNRYIKTVAAYNKVVLRFPTSIGASMRKKTVRPVFKSQIKGSERAPKVSFE